MAQGRSIEQLGALKVIEVEISGTISSRNETEITMREVVTGHYLNKAVNNLLEYMMTKWPDFAVECTKARFKY